MHCHRNPIARDRAVAPCDRGPPAVIVIGDGCQHADAGTRAVLPDLGDAPEGIVVVVDVEVVRLLDGALDCQASPNLEFSALSP